MTNYEYLIKTGKLEAFIWDLIDTTTIQSLNAQYGWELKADRYNNRRVAEWLQAERKESTKWVRLQDVLNLVKAPIDIDPMKKYRGLEILQMHDAYRIHLGHEIGILETKEIEDV